MTDRPSINSLNSDQLDALHRRAEQAEAVAAETKRLMERRTTTLRERAERAEATIRRIETLCDNLDATQPAGVPHPVASYIRYHLAGPPAPTASSNEMRLDATRTLTVCQPATAADVRAGAAEQQDIETALHDAFDRQQDAQDAPDA